MGAQIAAHFANAGVPSLLLDLTPEAAAEGLKRARTLKPDPFFTPDTWKLITTGGFDDGLSRLAEADWIIEAVVERLDVKRTLLEKVDAARRTGSIVSSNTSGIPIAALAEGAATTFAGTGSARTFSIRRATCGCLKSSRRPRPAPTSSRRCPHFADHRLGKGVVLAKDSPNFIGNHLALYGVVQLLAKVAAGEYTIEEIDAITGPAIGRPGSATFRTLDLAGVDILSHVIDNLHERLDDERAREVFVLPPFVRQMVERGQTGEKAGQGFYKRIKNASGESEILTLDPATLDYRPRQSPKLRLHRSGQVDR